MLALCVAFPQLLRPAVHPSGPRMSAAPAPAHKRAVLWDIDGTLVDSTKLCYEATNEVLTQHSSGAAVSLEQYKFGCRYTTPDRFNHHLGLPPGSAAGEELGARFDAAYVDRVSAQTAGLFSGIGVLLRAIGLQGHPQGVLSNAAGAYVRAVIKANELDEDAGRRISVFKVALGADEVAAPKPAADGLLQCCEQCAVEPGLAVYVGDSPSDGKAAASAGMHSIGVTWGANPEASLREAFDVVVSSVPELTQELRAWSVGAPPS